MTSARHSSTIKRLKRVEGHVRSLIAMMEGDRSCLDLAQQLQAIESAVAGAKRELVQEHMAHCVEDALAAGNISPQAAISEVRSIIKYL